MTIENGKQFTWEDISKAKGGTMFLDKFDEGIRFLILKGGSSLCAYIGVSISHPLAGFDYDDIPLDVHGGLTFSSEGNGKEWDNNFYWYGWDYAHSGDYCDYYDKTPLSEYSQHHSNDKKWLVTDVEKDSWSAIYDFKKLMKLSENVFNKKRTNVSSKQETTKID